MLNYHLLLQLFIWIDSGSMLIAQKPSVCLEEYDNQFDVEFAKSGIDHHIISSKAKLNNYND